MAGIILLAMVLLAGNAGAATNISSCTTIGSPGEYVLNKSINNASTCITITSNDVILDGAGYTINGTKTANTYGVHVYNSSITLTNVTVKNLTVTNWFEGIYYQNAQNGNVANNTASSNTDVGIYLASSSNNNNLTGNTANSNTVGILLASSSNNNNLTGNNASNNGNGIYLSSSSNNNLTSNNASSNTNYGIHISSNNNALSGNTANSNKNDGIYLSSSSNNNLTSNNASSNTNYGIYLFLSSNNNNLTGNTANSNKNDGIYLYYSSNNTLSGNTANSNTNYGIYLFLSSNNNALSGNNASNNNYGIYMDSSNSNTIYNNYFNNTNNAYDNGNNVWNTTKTAGTNIIGGSWLGGNYWSNYAGKDTDGDRLGDTLTPYKTGISNGGDYHPLTTTSTIDIYVNTTGWWRAGGAFNASGTRIQAAINAATNGDTIYVYNGSYSENMNVNKRVTLQGEGAGVVTVTAASTSRHVFDVTVDYVNISGFKVTGATVPGIAGIYLGSVGHGNISNNNASNNYDGILLSSSSNNTLSGNTANSNTNDGIYLLSSSSNNTLSGNTANSNTWFGILLFSSSNNTIYNNYFFNNTYNNAYDNGYNVWNTTKTAGTNIIGGSWLGGNYWSNYAGADTDGDGLGDTLTPYNSSGNISNGGDYHPLTTTSTFDISGYKINDTNGNGVSDSGESGIQGWNITLKNATGNVINTTATNSAGFYQFTNIEEGSYNVTEEDRAGWNHTNATFRAIDLYQNIMNLNFTNSRLFSVNTSTGTGTVYLSTDAGTIQDLISVNESDLPAAGKPNMQFPNGFLSFNITGLNLNQTVNVTIVFPSNIPITAQYWKYQTPGGWYQVPIGSNDGDNIITIQLKDGGIGDDIGIPDGKIMDPGGVGLPNTPPAPVPALNPAGLVALVGALSFVAISRIRRRGK